MKCLLIVPSRGRVDNCLRLLDAWDKTATRSDLVFAIDDDEVELYQPLAERIVQEFDYVEVQSAPRMGMAGTLNFWAEKYADYYDYIAFMGDDHLPITVGWDKTLCEAIGDKAGVAYANDLLQGENLPTSVVLSSSIVKTLGWMSPPTLKHLFMDNFWKAIGERLGNITYFPDVIIEHLHYTNGKAVHDERYQAVNTAEMHNHDQEAFTEYLARIDDDVARIKASE